ncbi:hypothetical protein [Dongia deserti]|uniref:hypothetical protein n=1 Tax=Dongia deserti TaxID=2268030 RepID=UPI0013C4AFE0|nr:hypothetical protein [Dongia deserti]
MNGINHKRGTPRRAAAILLALTGAIAAATPAWPENPRSSLANDDWSLSISPYVWGAGMEGSIASFPGALAADVDVSFNDILDHLDLAGMAIVQLRYQRFAAYMDLIYTSVSADQETPLGILFDDVELENEIFIGTFGGAYRAIETEHATLDLLAGVRVWSVDTVLKLEGGVLQDQEFEHGENWIDPIIGLHGHYQFENGIFLTSLSQVGGFGVSSDLTWDSFAGIGYRFNATVSAIAGYRHLEVDYENDGFIFDVEMSGPVIGMTIRL